MKRTTKEMIMAIYVNLEMARLAALQKVAEEVDNKRDMQAEYQSGKVAAFLEAINLIKTETQGIES